MARLVPFTPEHLARMDIKDDAKAIASHEGMVPALEKFGSTLLTDDGKDVLAIIGAVPTVPGVCEVFVVASNLQALHPHSFARPVKRLVLKLRKEYRRIQAVSLPDDFHARWLSWLGFVAEGVLHKYGMKGEDMVMWGLTEE